MAINRYFFQDPMVSGPLQFFAARNLQIQQKEAQEAAMQAQAQQQLYAGLGQGLGNAFQAYGGEKARQGAMDQRIGGLIDLAQAREQFQTQGNIHEAAQRAFIEAGGVPGQAPQVGPPMQLPGGPPPAGARPPMQPIQLAPGVQPGQQQPFDPMAVPPAPPQPAAAVPEPVINTVPAPIYDKKIAELNQLELYKSTVDTDPWMTDQERAKQTATMVPRIAALTTWKDTHQRAYSGPTMPGPQGDRVPLPIGETEKQDGSSIIHQEDGTIRKYMPSKVAEAPDLSTPDLRDAHIRRSFGGDLEAFYGRGGYVTIDEHGKVTPHEPKAGGIKPFDYGKFVSDAQKAHPRKDIDKITEQADAVEAAIEGWQEVRSVEQRNQQAEQEARAFNEQLQSAQSGSEFIGHMATNPAFAEALQIIGDAQNRPLGEVEAASKRLALFLDDAVLNADITSITVKQELLGILSHWGQILEEKRREPSLQLAP